EPDYVSINPSLPIVDELISSDNDEADLYFYHPDHLGSSSFISDVNGDVNQHLQYLPFGESFIDQQTNHNIRFTFSSKEKDSETGFGYFGARYYNSDISVWLSVDPMADKYPSLSAYNYCANNPVMLVDPDGMKIKIIHNGNKAIYKDGELYQRKFLCFGLKKYEGNDRKILQAASDLNFLSSIDSEINCQIETLVKSKKTHLIDLNNPSRRGGVRPMGIKNKTLANLLLYASSKGLKMGSNISYDFNEKDMGKRLANFGHEIFHGFELDQGIFSLINIINTQGKTIPLNEINAVNQGNRVRAYFGIRLRNTYAPNKINRLIPQEYLDNPIKNLFIKPKPFILQ
ncbi:MAG: RHS repeat-associated core domain-containing protein, partial [Saprospiraceae bacterium]|nr:RHS repeat-associated core domain-containing protein [Saprospiraceae bacterium]